MLVDSCRCLGIEELGFILVFADWPCLYLSFFTRMIFLVLMKVLSCMDSYLMFLWGMIAEGLYSVILLFLINILNLRKYTVKFLGVKGYSACNLLSIGSDKNSIINTNR